MLEVTLRHCKLLSHPGSSNSLPETLIMVNLDAEKGRRPRENPDSVFVVIRPSKVIRMAVIEAFLQRQMSFDKSILEAISKLTQMFISNPH